MVFGTQAIYANLLPLVSQFPLDLTSDESSELIRSLMVASRLGLIRSLGLPSDVNFRLWNKEQELMDQGSSVDCLIGLMELSRYLLDRAALSANAKLVDFLINRIFLDLLAFVFTCPITTKRWIYREPFSMGLFTQVLPLAPYGQGLVFKVG